MEGCKREGRMKGGGTHSPADDVMATHAALTTHHDAVRGKPSTAVVTSRCTMWIVAAKSRHCFARPTT
jgi:hypothetical protein